MKTHEKQCPVCQRTFTTPNKRKKNCSKRCAGLSTKSYHKPWSEERKVKQSLLVKNKYKTDSSYRTKVSQGLKKYFAENPDKIRRGEQQSIAVGKATKGKRGRQPKNILDCSLRTTRKILARLKIACSACGWNEDVCDIHHINGKKIPNPDAHTNLAYLCPTCHRLAHKNKLKEIVSLEQMIGENWLEYYYG